VKAVPDNQPVVTDSWSAYRECLRNIETFLRDINVRNTEVWLGDVCFGSPDNPGIRLPIRVDSAELVHRSIDHVQGLLAAVNGSLQNTVETSRRVMEELRRKGADESDLAAIQARAGALERLRTDLARATTLAAPEYHPTVLVRLREILGQSFVSGDPAVRVTVTTVYML
jgi:hypothetical protein